MTRSLIPHVKMGIANRIGHAARRYSGAQAGPGAPAWTVQRHRAGDLEHGGDGNFRLHGIHGGGPGQRARDSGVLGGGGAVCAGGRAELLRAGDQFSQLRRRVRLPDPRVRTRMGVHDGVGLVLRRVFGSHRHGGAGLLRLPRIFLPRPAAGEHAGGFRRGRADLPLRAGAGGGVRAHRRVHHGELLRNRAGGQSAERADHHQAAGDLCIFAAGIHGGDGKLEPPGGAGGADLDR